MTTLEILKAARELISVPERWTKGANARRSNRDHCGPADKQAVAWCAVGARIRVAIAPSKTLPIFEAEEALRVFSPHHNIEYFNDSARHPDVLALFDRAIARLSPAPSEGGTDG